MAEAIITTILDVTLSKAISVAEEQINLQLGFKDELNKLLQSLTLTRAYLRDAEMRQVDEPVQIWLNQLRQIASKADDVLDELAYEGLRRKVETQMRKKVRNFFSISKNPIVFCFKMPRTVKGISISLKEINNQAHEYGLQQRVHTLPSSSRGSQTTHSFIGDSSQVVGREADVSKIIDLLIDSSTRQNFSIVSIVGMGGLGKTTLAKSVCNNERIKNHFNKIMWVCVSEKFDVHRILQEMLESLTRQTCDLKNKDTILEKIKTELEGKTYLLTLDDVWDEDNRTWNDLRDSLLGININIRSSILVTTRSADIAIVRDASQENKYHLMSLQEEECWEIIKNRAFQNSSISLGLEDIGRDIARKCGGVPLVANVIGGTMSNKLDIDEWMSLRDGSHWGSLEKNEGIVDVLKLSFDRLHSSSLKQCFVYCSIFPKDFLIKKDQLIQLWMAEGFLQQVQGNSQLTFEDIGNEYFNDLLCNSLLQDVEKDEFESITCCKMHDLVHDLAQSIRNSETSNTSHSQPQNAFDDAKLWHSLFSKSSSLDIKADFKNLRVLNFCTAKIDSLPDSISRLKHLRYFDISGTKIKRLPKSITQFYHLQTLKLLHCRFLGELPKGMKSLVSLRHLYISDDQLVPDEIGCLTNLRTLPVFDVCIKNGHGIGKLGCLSELGGELEISNLQNVRNKKEAQGAKIWEKKKLHKLTYRWGSWREGYNNDEEVLEGLEPHSDLKSLRIEYYMGESNPSWLVKKSVGASFQSFKLVRLNLYDCKKLKNVPTLGLYYPNLKYLRIWSLDNVECIGNEFYVNNNNNNNTDIKLFPALEIFDLLGMKELKEWLDVEPLIPVFPSLKHLTIMDCDKLSSIPVMSRFSSLETLTIHCCLELSLIGDELFPSTLKEINIGKCGKLSSIPGVEGATSLKTLTLGPFSEELEEFPGLSSIHHLHSSLKELYLKGWKKLTTLPDQLQHLTALNILSISGFHEVKALPEWFGSLSSLQSLTIEHCENLKHLPSNEAMQRLSNLKTLQLGPFSEELEEFPSFSSIHPLHSSIEDLTLAGWEKLSSLPDQLQHFTALKKLSILRFSGVKALPDWLGNLSSLRELSIWSCYNLGHLPSIEAMQCLSNMQYLQIVNCPLLKENSVEKSKISHIPRINIL